MWLTSVGHFVCQPKEVQNMKEVMNCEQGFALQECFFDFFVRIVVASDQSQNNNH